MKKNLLLIVFIFFFLFLSPILNAQIVSVHGFQSVPITLEKVSPPLKDIPKHSYPKHGQRGERDNPSLERPMKPTNPNALPKGADPAWQKSFPAGVRDVNIDVLSTWDGMSENIDPSDNTIAVGPNHVIQMVNASTATFLRIWDKEGNILTDELAVNDISGLGDIGDPNLIYDPVGDRFVLLVINSNFNKIIVCITQTNDPMGSWYSYSFNASGPDYPKIAYWGNSYFITTNSSDPTVFAINRDSLLVGAPIGTAQKFTMSNLPSIDFESASPIHFTGTQSPDADTPAYMIRVADDAWGGSLDSDHLEIFNTSIDWVNSGNSYIQGPFNLGTIPYNSEMCGFNSFSCIPQPNSNTKLDPLTNIIMDKAQYRRFDDHETIVCTHVCNMDGNGLAGIRWYELRKNSGGDWFIYQQSSYAPDDSIHRWMSSVSINGDGAIALGYNVCNGTSIYPGARITGRASCDSLDIMTAGEINMVDGINHNATNRYGDYNGMLTDPVDGSFWFTAQYNPGTNWGTSVIHFTISSCLATAITETPMIDASLKVVPQPAGDLLEVSFTHDGNESSKLQVLDRSGAVIMEETISLISGNNQLHFDVTSLPNGFYILKIPGQKRTLIGKLVIQHG